MTANLNHNGSAVSAKATEPVAEDTAEVLREMCRSLSGLLAVGDVPARRVVMTAGPVSLEVEWPAETAAAVAASRGSAVAAEPESAETGTPVVSPLVGTFYRSPQPGAAPFVEVGDLVRAGQQVGIVEAMKLMNPVESHRDGRVVRIAAGDAEAVEYEQTLIVLDTDAVGGEK